MCAVRPSMVGNGWAVQLIAEPHGCSDGSEIIKGQGGALAIVLQNGRAFPSLSVLCGDVSFEC